MAAVFAQRTSGVRLSDSFRAQQLHGERPAHIRLQLGRVAQRPARDADELVPQRLGVRGSVRGRALPAQLLDRSVFFIQTQRLHAAC